MRVKKDRCTEMTTGTVMGLKSKGLDKPTLITVSYQVRGEHYEVTESLKLKSEVIKLGFLPIGQRKYPAMGEVKAGVSTQVSFNPENPAEAYITKNTGKVNI